MVQRWPGWPMSCTGTDSSPVNPVPLLSHSICRNGRLQCTQIKLLGHSKFYRCCSWMATSLSLASLPCLPGSLNSSELRQIS